MCNVRMQTLCTNHARNEIGGLTVCHSEQQYLCQIKFVLNGTFHLILPRDPLLRPSQCLSLLCMIPNQTKRHMKNLFWTRFGCSLWQTVSTPISFLAWLVNNICILTLQVPFYIHNRDIPKKAPQKYPAFTEILSFVAHHCWQQWARHVAFWQKPLAFFAF